MRECVMCPINQFQGWEGRERYFSWNFSAIDKDQQRPNICCRADERYFFRNFSETAFLDQRYEISATH
jgi:hypothetical protein